MGHPAHAERFHNRDGEESALLSWDDLDLVLGVLAEIAPSWSAELNQSGPDDSTIVVVPEGANDLIGPAFVLHRSHGRVQLDQFRWDEYRKLGGYFSLQDALAALRARLVPLVSSRPPASDRAEG